MSYSVKSLAPLSAKFIGVILWSGYVAAGTVACARAVGKEEREDLWPPAVAGAAVGFFGMLVYVFKRNATVGQCVVAPLIGGVVSAAFYGLSEDTGVKELGDGKPLFMTLIFSAFFGIMPSILMSA